jgi:hypothetical protein
VDQDDKCWQCGKPFRGGRRILVQMVNEDQSVFVGPACAKVIAKRGTIEATKGTFIKAVIAGKPS